MYRDLNDLLITPFEGGTADTQKLFSFFLYRAPGIESAHSKRIPTVKHSAIFNMIRHIRNSIAHGRIYYSHTGNRIHIVFEDANSTGNLSARIVCIKADLEHWKRILSNPEVYR